MNKMILLDYLFVGSIIFGLIAVIMAFYASKYEVVQNSPWFKRNAIAILVLAVGFVVHMTGDFLSQFYGHTVELNIESLAHVILLVGFLLFFYASKQVLNISKEYGFK